MFKIDVNADELTAFLAAGERAMGRVDANILNIAKQGAERLRKTDHYQNRTGELRANTQALGARGRTILEMGMFYASFVNDLGFSNFDEVEEWVKQQVDQGIDRMLEDL